MKNLITLIREQKLFWRFTWLSLIAIIFMTFFALSIISPAIQDFIITDSERQAVVLINRFAQTRLTNEYFNNPQSKEAISAFNLFFEILPIRGLVTGMLVNPDGKIIFVPQENNYLMEESMADDQAFIDATNLKPSAFFQTLSEKERGGLGLNEAFVMYLPITLQGTAEPLGVLKTISRTGFIQEAIQKTEDQIRYRIIIGAAILYLLLAIIVWQASKTIVQQTKDLKIYADRLAKSLEREKEVSALQSQFITVASHQLNTPLSAIGWAVDLMHESKKDLQLAIESIEKSFYTLRSIVFDLLTVSEIGFNYARKENVTINFNQLSKDVLKEFEQRISEKKIVLDLKILDSLPDINGDFLAIKKVLENLIDNAIVYSNEGGKISIESYKNGDDLEWKISDNGIGIPETDKQSIFRQLFRASNAIEKKNVGSGLGLFIAKTIIEGHEGKITFVSEQNKGTTFVISLPIP